MDEKDPHNAVIIMVNEHLKNVPFPLDFRKDPLLPFLSQKIKSPSAASELNRVEMGNGTCPHHLDHLLDVNLYYYPSTKDGIKSVMITKK